MKRIILTVVFLFLASVAYAQTGTFTLSFEHDGLNTDSYAQTIDGVRTVIVPTCVVAGTTRTCSNPITLTLNVVHTVTVIAVGTFGESVSLPFVCDVPKAPVNNKVKK